MPFIVSARNTFFRMSAAGAAVASTVKQFLFGTQSGNLYTIDENNNIAQISGFSSGGNSINDIEYISSASTVFVVANSGKAFSSTNLTSWTTINTGVIENIKIIKNGGDTSAEIASIWITRTSNFFYNTSINSIAYGNGLWIAGGFGGQLRTSTDGSTWVTQTSNFGTSPIRSVAYGNGLWMAAGDLNYAIISTNGVSWTSISPGPAIIYSVAYGNGLWVLGQGGVSYPLIYTSTDLVLWYGRTSNFGTAVLRSVAYGNGLWIAGGDYGTLRTSTDGSTWVTQESNFGATTIYSVAYGNGLWTAVGASRQIRTSTNAIAWVTRLSNFSQSNFSQSNIFSIAYGNSLWIAAGDYGQIRTSSQILTNFKATMIGA